MNRPTEQLRAGHRPSGLVPDGVHPMHVTVNVAAPREYAGPVLLILAGSAGVCATIFLLTQLAVALVPFAGFTVGGISFALWRRS